MDTMDMDVENVGQLASYQAQVPRLITEFRGQYPKGLFALQVGGTLPEGESLVELFVDKAGAENFFSTYVEQVEGTGLKILRDRLIMNIDTKHPYERKKVDVYQSIYLRTITLMRYPFAMTQEDLLKLNTLVAAPRQSYPWFYLGQ